MKLPLTNLFFASALLFSGSAQICDGEDKKAISAVQALLDEFNVDAQSKYEIVKVNGEYMALRSGQPGIKSREVIEKYYSRGQEFLDKLAETQALTSCPLDDSMQFKAAFIDIYNNYQEFVEGSEPPAPGSGKQEQPAAPNLQT